MKIAVVSTYPQFGSQNIGDSLITETSINLLNELLHRPKISRVFHSTPWVEARPIIEDADHVLIACLAIRQHGMGIKTYTFMSDLIASGKPYTVIAAGTRVPVYARNMRLPQQDGSLVEWLRKLSDNSNGFSTRGKLTQWFCDHYKIRNKFCGDIAFYNPRFSERTFIADRTVKRIVISSPHYWRACFGALKHLIYEVSTLFPDAKITIAVHGKSSLNNYLKDFGVDVRNIFEDGVSGLDVYDEADLHVGFRVHGHVSALSRRKYSYLIEQDGRGADYGITIPANISVDDHVSEFDVLKAQLFGWRKKDVTSSAVTRIISKIRRDMTSGFEGFTGLERTIEGYNSDNRAFLASSLNV